MIFIVSGGPWNVEDLRLILQPLQELIPHFSDEFFLVDFWVQIWDLPNKWYSERVCRILLGYLRNCSAMQLLQQWNLKMKFYRCRIKIDIMRTLQHYLYSGESSKEERHEVFKYELCWFFAFSVAGLVMQEMTMSILRNMM